MKESNSAILRVRFQSSALALLIGGMLFGGCAEVQESPLGPRYHPANVSSHVNLLAPSLKRVAVLPLAGLNSTFDMQAGVETLEPILVTELQKRNRFEVVPVSRADMAQWTGKQTFRGDEVLPQDALARIQKETGCDGVLFAMLTVYRPYAPTAIGWRMKLATVSDKAIVWAADEVFDAANADVVNSARDYQRKQPELRAGLREGRKILLSPSAFGHFTAETLLNTLPH